MDLPTTFLHRISTVVATDRRETLEALDLSGTEVRHGGGGERTCLAWRIRLRLLRRWKVEQRREVVWGDGKDGGKIGRLEGA